jgi:Protein of unknown function (DUF1588)
MKPAALSLVLLLGLAACKEEAPPAPSEVELLSPRDQLIRLSVETRGVFPTDEEIAAIEQSPQLYGDFVDRYLADPRFSQRLRELLNLRFLTRTGETWFPPSEAGLGMVDELVVASSLADEPLRLASHLYENDLPWTGIVTADYTMGDAIVAQMWGLESLEGDFAADPSWQPARYLDGRPHAGILTMTTTWQRYPSMGGNANRHRANAVSRLLLCDDYLSRPIVLDRAAVDQLTEDPETAIGTNPSCQSCHSTLDPLSAHFFGFFFEEEPEGLLEATTYRPEGEQAWREYSGKAPAYYGHPTGTLEELGLRIGEDPRFVDCAVQTFASGLLQREMDRSTQSDDWEEMQVHRAEFTDNGLLLRPLLRSILMSDSFRAESFTTELGERQPVVRTASPAQIASIMADLTGYDWTFSGQDGLRDNALGLAVLAGGVDGAFVSVPAYEPSVGTAFVQERLAQTAAWNVASHDLDPARTGAARLLQYVTIEDTPASNPEAFEAQIRHLYATLTRHPLPDKAAEPAQLMALWQQVYSVEGSPVMAWTAVLSAVLRDPALLFY